MRLKDPPFKHIVDAHGFYTDEYKEWATKAENYPGSSLQIEDIGGDVKFKEFMGTILVETGIPFNKPSEATICAAKIKEMGGISGIIPCQRRNKKMYMIWFNPNGSQEAREYVSGW
jgi:predicted TIM-barrel fold metal-dependent hydrolase